MTSVMVVWQLLLLEMSLHSSFGANITIPHWQCTWLHLVKIKSYIVATENDAALIRKAEEADVPITRIGSVTTKTDLQFGEKTPCIKELERFLRNAALMGR